MDPSIVERYAQYRAKGWRAEEALRAAKVTIAFDAAESRGLVQLRCEPECDDLSMFEPDWKGLFPRECDRERARKAWLKDVENEGLWRYTTEVRATVDADWERADSCGGFVGTCIDTGYDIDLKSGALIALDELTSEEADELAERATFAGVPA